MIRKPIHCTNCGYDGFSDDVIRSCGNCFACLGCEIYICPECGLEIIIKPLPG